MRMEMKAAPPHCDWLRNTLREDGRKDERQTEAESGAEQ